MVFFNLVFAAVYSPRWIQKPYNVTLYQGQTYTIPCKAEGRPDPSYTWTKDGLKISTAGVNALASGKLQFNSAKKFHSGQYTCVAANRMGSEYANIYVQVVDGK